MIRSVLLFALSSMLLAACVSTELAPQETGAQETFRENDERYPSARDEMDIQDEINRALDE